MEGIEFETDKSYSSKEVLQAFTPKESSFVKLLVKLGVNDATTANYVLLGIAALFFGITVFLYAGILGGGSASSQSAEQIMAHQRLFNAMEGIK